MLNRAEIIGNLGQDPEINAVQGGEQRVASFSVATTDRAYTRKDGTQVPEQTEWHNVVLFGKLADVAQQYLHKGSKVYVAGKMRTETYTKDGNNYRVMRIVANALEMLGTKGAAQTAQTTQAAPTQAAAPQRETIGAAELKEYARLKEQERMRQQQSAQQGIQQDLPF